ncbi:MAG: 50S ribosomal protein L1 [Phycisphaeraceae bacterium]|nr:50S ribosomal protein L1 [Phycisphaeraceae bacterium]
MATRHAGKRYRADLETVDLKKALPLNEAMEKVRSFRKAKFDQSVEMCIHLGVDPKQADQIVRGSLSLPHGIGKTKRVVAFCTEDKIAACKEAGAIEAGGDDLIKKITEGWMDFDVAIASPDMMRTVSRLGKTLGPRGLMPSPKAGTVTADVAGAVKEYAAGKVEFRNDTGGNVHVVVGKLSFDTQKLVDNAQAFLDTIHRIKPSAAKGQYIKKISVSGTMTPGVLVTF